MCFVRKEEYKDSLKMTKDAEFNADFYIDYVIWPEDLLTQEIFRIITVAKALDVENFANGETQLLNNDNLIIFTTCENAPIIRDFF